jgi:hypothetical protein
MFKVPKAGFYTSLLHHLCGAIKGEKYERRHLTSHNKDKFKGYELLYVDNIFVRA